MPQAVRSRELAYETLLELEKKGGKADELIRAVTEKYEGCDVRDLAFYRRLTEGVIERRITLDYVIDLYASTKSTKMKRPVRLLLRMGVYQILYMEAVPDRAAVDESVKLAVRKGLSGLKGFINGVLRSVAAAQGEIHWPSADEDPVRYLEVRDSMPDWIVRRFLQQFGRERAERILGAYREDRPLTVRLRDAAEEKSLTERWMAAGIGVRSCPYLSGSLYLTGIRGITEIPGYAQGAFFVQDVSATLAVMAAGIRPGDTVADVCAAPGGKSIMAALLTGETGSVHAFDLTEKKVSLIRENAKRLGLKRLDCAVQDATVLREELCHTADVVIADLPCSGLGVLGRKSDIRYRVVPEDILSLQKLQREILKTAVNYVKPGGVLMYSTCTVTKEENEENREWIINGLSLEPEPITEQLPEVLRSETTDKGYLQLVGGEPEGFPQLDGFFIARFRKR